MKHSESIREAARRELLSGLDFYVESITVHTCTRLNAVQALLGMAGWDQLYLLMAWADSEDKGQSHE